MVSQDVSEGRQCLMQYLLTVGNKKQPRLPLLRVKEPPEIECGYNRFTCACCRNNEISKAVMGYPFTLQRFQYTLLKGVGRDVEEYIRCYCL